MKTLIKRTLAPLRAAASELPKLESELRAMAQRLAELKAEHARRHDISYFINKMQRTADQYEISGKPEDLEEAILAQMICRDARQRMNIDTMYGQVDPVAARFRSEFGNWREKLAKFCALKLQLAKADLQRITADEKKRLADEYGEEEVVTHSLPIRRAADVVRRLEFRFKAIQNDPAEDCWKKNADALLNGQ